MKRFEIIMRGHAELTLKEARGLNDEEILNRFITKIQEYAEILPGQPKEFFLTREDAKKFLKEKNLKTTVDSEEKGQLHGVRDVEAYYTATFLVPEEEVEEFFENPWYGNWEQGCYEFIGMKEGDE